MRPNCQKFLSFLSPVSAHQLSASGTPKTQERPVKRARPPPVSHLGGGPGFSACPPPPPLSGRWRARSKLPSYHLQSLKPKPWDDGMGPGGSEPG